MQAVAPLERSCGILLHPTSLPGAFGIGGLGAEARAFVEFLAAGRQSLWQVLPLGPTGYGDSPYQSFSAFAGNPLLIDPPTLAEEGLLAAADLADPPAFPEERVDYGTVIPYRTALLSSAWRRWNAGTRDRGGLEAFRQASASWLPDYALFMALKRHFAQRGLHVWNRWPAELARREADALRQARLELAEAIGFEEFQQYQFFRQWGALKRLAAEKGLRLIGDIPIFVAFDSADVWAHQELFRLTASREPEVVAGVPPDYFSPTGQLWGNPLYDWKRLAADGLPLVVGAGPLGPGLGGPGSPGPLPRLPGLLGGAGRQAHRRARALGQGARGRPARRAGRRAGRAASHRRGPGRDHPRGGKTAGPLRAPGDEGAAVRLRRGRLQFLPAPQLRRATAWCTPARTTTTRPWAGTARKAEKTRDQVRRYLARDGHDVAWDLVRLAYASVASMAVVPLQDLMKLGTEARMNYPSRAQGNWQWRFTPAMLSGEISGRLRELALLYGRCPPEPEEPEKPARAGSATASPAAAGSPAAEPAPR